GECGHVEDDDARARVSECESRCRAQTGAEQEDDRQVRTVEHRVDRDHDRVQRDQDDSERPEGEAAPRATTSRGAHVHHPATVESTRAASASAVSSGRIMRTRRRRMVIRSITMPMVRAMTTPITTLSSGLPLSQFPATSPMIVLYAAQVKPLMMDSGRKRRHG